MIPLQTRTKMRNKTPWPTKEYLLMTELKVLRGKSHSKSGSPYHTLESITFTDQKELYCLCNHFRLQRARDQSSHVARMKVHLGSPRTILCETRVLGWHTHREITQTWGLMKWFPLLSARHGKVGIHIDALLESKLTAIGYLRFTKPILYAICRSLDMPIHWPSAIWTRFPVTAACLRSTFLFVIPLKGP